MDIEEAAIILQATIMDSKVGIDTVKFKRHKINVSFQYPK